VTFNRRSSTSPLPVREPGVDPVFHQAATDEYFDTGRDGRAFGCVIEWGVLEHMTDVVACIDNARPRARRRVRHDARARLER
jgi:hypothetical protein